MINRVSIVAAAGLLIVGLTSLSAEAQAPKLPEPKGVKVTGLVSSLGGFSATVTTPLLLTGATVELEPGGQTGKQQFRVPTYIYILEGVLVTDYEVGAPAELVADLVAAGDEVLYAGDGALRYREELAEVDRSEQAGPSYAFPSAAALVELATARVEREDFVSPEAVQPLYLRRSDAEIEWKRREAS